MKIEGSTEVVLGTSTQTQDNQEEHPLSVYVEQFQQEVKNDIVYRLKNLPSAYMKQLGEEMNNYISDSLKGLLNLPAMHVEKAVKEINNNISNSFEVLLNLPSVYMRQLGEGMNNYFLGSVKSLHKASVAYVEQLQTSSEFECVSPRLQFMQSMDETNKRFIELFEQLEVTADANVCDKCGGELPKDEGNGVDVVRCPTCDYLTMGCSPQVYNEARNYVYGGSFHQCTKLHSEEANSMEDISTVARIMEYALKKL